MLQKLEAVIPRISTDFARLPDLEYEMAREMKGYIGERKVDYFLDPLAGKCSILRGVCLNVQGKKFQIDTLVITENAIYIVEIKNFNGTITFDSILNQFTRDDGEKEIGYRHPITQAELQQMCLENWLHERNYKNIPIHFFIAISDPATVIKVTGDAQSISRVVAHGEHIPRKILDKEKEIGKGVLQHHHIGEAILRECEEHDFDVLRKFGVKPSDITPGVRCPGCGFIGMGRRNGKWYCLKCKMTSRHAQSKALSDFLLLIKPSISNKECKQFLQVNSRAAVTRMLQQSNLIYQIKYKRWCKS